MTTTVQEIRIASLQALTVPDGIHEGSVIEISCRLRVASVDQDWIDVTTQAGKPEKLPGSVTLGCVPIQWAAT